MAIEASPVLRPASQAPRWGGPAAAAAIIAAAGLSLLLGPAPTEPIIPVAQWISAASAWFVSLSRPLARAISAGFGVPLGYLQWFLTLLPWPIVVLAAATVGLLAAGRRLAMFCALAFFYVILVGYWEKTALTLALVAVAIPLSAGIGLLFGIWGARSPAAGRVMGPILDLMQTIPTFAYLIPILVLFGIGPMVGVTASAVYAIPPMIRNVMLALQRVPEPIIEAGLTSGCTRRQLLWWVEIPAAMPGILVGLNQTIMAGLSMVVVAAMLGGANDIGLEVFNTMKQAKFGESILAGLVIALLAMAMDRVSRGFADGNRAPGRSRAGARKVVLAAGAIAAVLLVLSVFVPQLASYPREWTVYPARALNDALSWFTVVAFPVTSAIKSWTAFYLLLPLKVGLPAAVQPMTWGFAMSPAVAVAYWSVVAVLAALLAFRAFWRSLVLLVAVATLYYCGTTGLPWPLTIAAVTALALYLGGVRTALLAFGGLLFILLNGIWLEAMVTVQLCIVGVALSFLLGSAIGVWAALDDRVSAIVRPMCDTLQTLPIFVFLIPAIMVFLVGEFTALIAIVLYAFVPAIRYTEHGIRTVPAEIVEASRSMGTTRLQRLVDVQLPIALPEIMLGLNQVIMFALSMVIVAALVGAKGLGQEIMVALTHANTGKGLVAGLAIAFIAVIVDRMVQAWSMRKKLEFGL